MNISAGSVRDRMVGLCCPACGYGADGATNANDGPAATKVKPLDFCICYKCGAINRYLEGPTTPSGLTVRSVTPEEWAALQRDPRLSKLFAALAKARTEVLRRIKP